MLAKLFIKEGNISTAIDVLTKASEFNLESSDIFTLLGLLFMRVNFLNQIIEKLKKTV